jgi:hypothetical protein
MKNLLSIPLLIAAGLLLTAGVLHGLRDRSIFTAPPDAVTEGFVRELETGRYPRAIPYMTRELRADADEKRLAAYIEQIERRTGKIEDVSGELEWIGEDSASARAVLHLPSGDTTSLTFPLLLREYEWKIAALTMK